MRRAPTKAAELRIKSGEFGRRHRRYGWAVLERRRRHRAYCGAAVTAVAQPWRTLETTETWDGGIVARDDSI